MASVCVGCGLKVVSGKLTLDAEAVSAHVPRSASYPNPGGMNGAQLAIIAPTESNGSQSHAVGVATTELAVLELENPYDCRSITCLIVAHGRTRIDVNTGDEADGSSNNEVRNEIRVNNGDWLITDLSSFAQVGTRQSREWNDIRVIPPVVIPPLGTLTIDRRATFRWEDVIVASVAVWNMPAISVIGF